MKKCVFGDVLVRLYPVMALLHQQHRFAIALSHLDALYAYSPLTLHCVASLSLLFTSIDLHDYVRAMLLIDF